MKPNPSFNREFINIIDFNTLENYIVFGCWISVYIQCNNHTFEVGLFKNNHIV